LFFGVAGLVRPRVKQRVGFGRLPIEQSQRLATQRAAVVRCRQLHAVAIAEPQVGVDGHGYKNPFPIYLVNPTRWVIIFYMNTIQNAHGETTSLTKSTALDKAKHYARYRHGDWFVWQHKSGEWYVGRRTNAVQVQDAADNVKPESKVYSIGGGGPHSMTFVRYGSNIVQMWARSVAVAGD
jgi:hypothetical protein